MAGRTIAYGMPDAVRSRSTSALPRKYGYGDAMSAWVIETCTIRWTSARVAASNRTRLFPTAVSCVTPARGNRTQ